MSGPEDHAPEGTGSLFNFPGTVEAIRSDDPDRIEVPSSIYDFWEADMIRVLRQVYRAARIGSIKRDQPFELSTDDVAYMMKRSLGRCELTGIKFTGDNFTASRRRPFVPSIDRINPKEPYRLDNCRLVAWIVNLAISDWGEDTFWTMVKAAGKRGRYAPLADAIDRDQINREVNDLMRRAAKKRIARGAP